MQKLVIGLVRTYQKIVPPFLLKGHCRFEPTCSNYAILAVKKYGALKGLVKSFWRVLHCSPLSKGGVDLPYFYLF
ncbi:MAG: membrane protein insertion efficiency factor YidD [Parcubacteria group bacterium CG1_02_37_13]|nr:MAG: membrane protein insertion efficiency factor YidD [Parcubacteria group bacterium CG1_02_37_13]